MKNFKLDKYEQKIDDAIANGEFERVPNFEQEKKRYQEIARATVAMRKNKNVNIRISEHDLNAIKAKAMERGLPYQTLVSSVLHQYSNGRIKELA